MFGTNSFGATSTGLFGQSASNSNLLVILNFIKCLSVMSCKMPKCPTVYFTQLTFFAQEIPMGAYTTSLFECFLGPCTVGSGYNHFAHYFLLPQAAKWHCHIWGDNW